MVYNIISATYSVYTAVFHGAIKVEPTVLLVL